VIVYAQSCGLPILLIGYFGGQITRDMPHVFSLADFVGWRYGPIAKTCVFLITMFVMCIFVLAEYTTIGTIFSDFVGSVSYGIVLIIGVLTLTYTAYGGLAVSIATDQAQGIASMLLALILAIYVAVTYRCGWGPGVDKCRFQGWRDGVPLKEMGKLKCAAAGETCTANAA
jgi:Na+/proline symporter